VLVKVALLFLLAMAVIGWAGSMLGRRGRLARVLGRLPRLPGAKGRARGRVCPGCGRPRIGAGPCACGRA
jgi:hypothetical protein